MFVGKKSFCLHTDKEGPTGDYCELEHISMCSIWRLAHIYNCGPEAWHYASSLISNKMTIVFKKAVEVTNPQWNKRCPLASQQTKSAGKIFLIPFWAAASAKNMCIRNASSFYFALLAVLAEKGISLLIFQRYLLYIYGLIYGPPLSPVGILSGLHNSLFIHFILTTSLWGRFSWKSVTGQRSPGKLLGQSGNLNLEHGSWSDTLTTTSYWISSK